MYRILFTSVGRRVELVQAFRDASFTTKIPLRIYGADMDETAPALRWCDEVRMMCRICDDAYIPNLLEVCKADDIDLVIPTIDTDLMKLAEARTAFEALGTRVFIADRDKVALCRDKRLTGNFFESCGLLAPKTFDDWKKYPGPFPCFIKPKDGSSSINAYRAENRDELRQFAGRISDYIVQPFVSGNEYTIDAFCDYEGNTLTIVPRERMAVRAGEVLKTRVDLDEKMILETESILNSFRPRGPITIQLIRDQVAEDDWFIEINPRFGGGAPLSMRAGARSAELALRMIAGEYLTRVPITMIANGAIYSRFDQCVRVDSSPVSHQVKGVVFDLDDTLFVERDYVRSGFKAIAKHLKEPESESELWGSFLEGLPAIDAYVDAHRCENRKYELLDVYRKHQPSIELDNAARDLLLLLRQSGIRIGVITDGRPEGQRAKMDALHLWDLVDDVIITDELGGPQFRKPCDLAFRIMQRKWGIPFEQMIYVGDNPDKDFFAPRQLGMQWMQVSLEGALHPEPRSCMHKAKQVHSYAEVLNRLSGVCFERKTHDFN